MEKKAGWLWVALCTLTLVWILLYPTLFNKPKDAMDPAVAVAAGMAQETPSRVLKVAGIGVVVEFRDAEKGVECYYVVESKALACVGR